MNKIIINATASHSSGALSIYKDFINFIKSYDDKRLYYVFTSVNEFSDSEFIKFIYMDKMNWKQRIEWDKNGVRNWCKENSIEPSLIISLQNTCANYFDIPQLVYYHQPLPLIPYQWNPLKKTERVLFLYAHFYKFFVNKYNKNAHYVVQLPYIKKLFLKKFKNLSDDDVFVIRPNSPSVNLDAYREYEHKFRFIYPATPLEYKNHKVIVNAIKILKKKNPYLLENFEVIFTCDKTSFVGKLVKKNNLEDIVLCIGTVSYDKMMEYYKNSDVLLFPSKIETYGMPLIEAAKFGLEILAADLSYANEVLEKYNNKVFIGPNDKKEWAKQIEKCIMTKDKVINNNRILQNEKENSWSIFFEIVSSILSNTKEK